MLTKITVTALLEGLGGGLFSVRRFLNVSLVFLNIPADHPRSLSILPWPCCPCWDPPRQRLPVDPSSGLHGRNRVSFCAEAKKQNQSDFEQGAAPRLQTKDRGRKHQTLFLPVPFHQYIQEA